MTQRESFFRTARILGRGVIKIFIKKLNLLNANLKTTQLGGCPMINSAKD